MSDESKCDLRIPYAWLSPIAKLLGLLLVAASGGGLSHYFGAETRQDAAGWDTKVWRDQYKVNDEVLAALKRIEERQKP